MGNALKTSSFTKDFNELAALIMLGRLVKDKLLVTLVVLIVAMRVFALNEEWVEKYYTYGLYPVFSRSLRIIFGWIPFSVGDLLYTTVVLFILLKIWKVFSLARQKRLRAHLTATLAVKYLKVLLGVYVVFNLFWGLNYDRQGIAKQLDLHVKEYSEQELIELTCLLQKQLNFYASKVDTAKRNRLDHNHQLFTEAKDAYTKAVNAYPFLAYHSSSLKPSMFSSVGHYLGFTGYYNPFTGEAQLKTSVPEFLKPFIICHEIGHQLGYAKENEANFISYLSCKNSGNTDFLYSIYFDLYRYALNNLMQKNFLQAYTISKGVNDRVKNDLRTLRAYFQRTKNPIEPFANKFYDQYLKMNNQPKGYETYSEVVAWLIAYQKKFGNDAI
jgi:hypothetical protein